MSRVAPTDATVLISGETGTGKELFARAIHAASRRTDSAFIKFDCAARPSRLRTLELFADGEGALDLASGGTILLDEIAELAPDAQAELLPALQERIDVRIIVTTNRDLRKAVREGRFREDLYYRLNVFPIELPPLRARPTTFRRWCRFFAQKYAPRVGRRVDGVDPDTLAALSALSLAGQRARAGEPRRTRARPEYRAGAQDPAGTSGGARPTERAALIAAAAGMTPRPTARSRRRSSTTPKTPGCTRAARTHPARAQCHALGHRRQSGAALKLGMKPATLRHRMKKLGIARAQSPQASGRATSP